ncbi:dipeptidyl-peptidase 3 [Penicillium malachiteum]|uniref:dipeptidyl-peptidase 3 n=1 Tax=Penicillium malachiteum TaxID=1324776 RepID=UPI002547EBDE|nr:dipeptidyl-peptidase 3 [Penicillium malachiteum]KAJ5714472.1 dipeptidyl-peptidase 3 [Penicillium malachiteum]
MHRACNGKWQQFCDTGISKEELHSWLEFAGMFMSNLGNYFADGDRKTIPDVSEDALRRMASISLEITLRLDEIIDPMMAVQPSKLGYPDETSQSSFYPGEARTTKEEIVTVTRLIETQGVGAENTRVRKTSHHDAESGHWDEFQVVQACVEIDEAPGLIGDIKIGKRPGQIFLHRGDHSKEMNLICAELQEAQKYAASAEQVAELAQLIQSFQTGDYQTDFWSALKMWVKDKAPPFPGRVLRITERGLSNEVISRLRTFKLFTSWHFVSSIFWEANNINLNNNDGHNYGVKNLIYGNRMSLINHPGRPCYYVYPSEAGTYMACAHIVHFIGTAIHEVIGHGSGKLLAEQTPGEFNFDHERLPLSPITSQSIQTWYKPNEIWDSVFGKLALTAEECRAFLFAYYFADNQEIVARFGYHETRAEGLRALHSFKPNTQTWGGDHHQALPAIFKHLVQDGDGVMTVDHDPVKNIIFVRVDRSKNMSHGKLSIGRMLCKIHIWHSTADINACRPFYEDLSTVDGQYETWRNIVIANKEPKWKFVQPNTFLKGGGTVELREYEASNVGVIQSFYERDI